MKSVSTRVLAAAICLATSGASTPGVIEVACSREGALARALRQAAKVDSAEIRLDGLCEGPLVLSAGDVTLRASTPGSGLAAAEDQPPESPLLEIRDARVTLRGTVLRGGGIGARVTGPRSELLLVEVDVEGQTAFGLNAEAGSTLRVLDSEIRDGNIGILVRDNSSLNVQRSHVHGLDVGVIVSDRSFAALSDTVVEGCATGGMNVTGRSDVNILGGAFRDNSQVHINANDWSQISLLNGVELGSPDDPTEFALGATRGSRVQSGSIPVVHGHLSVLDGASIRLFGATLHGDVVASHFADAVLTQATVGGIVFCAVGADVICQHASSSGVIGCPSTTCGPPLAAATAAPVLQAFP